MDWRRNWLVHFNARKAQLVLFDWSIDVKMERSVLEEKSSLIKYAEVDFLIDSFTIYQNSFLHFCQNLFTQIIFFKYFF